jgi:putative ABC transport system permease protein
MNWNARIRAALAAAGQRPDEDVVEELSQHAQALYDERRADGATADEAGGVVEQQIAVWCSAASILKRRQRRAPVVVPPPSNASGPTGILHDVRYALRLLRRRPGASAVTVLTMALGIGATTVLFSVVWGVLFKPLPWPDADRLVRVMETREGSTRRLRNIFTNGTYLAWKEAPSTIEELSGWASRNATLTGAGEPQRVRLAAVTPSVFTMLRAQPALGSVIVEPRGGAVDESALVLSYGLWQQRFGGTPDVLGRVVQLDGQSRTVIGVMPRDFSFPDADTRGWTALAIRPVRGEGNQTYISLFAAMARLKPGVTPQQAADEATARGRAGADPGLAGMAVFGSRGPTVVTAAPVLDAMTQEVRPALLVLLAAVGLLLVTATANVASVQLARATTRRREMAIRSALGAGSGRIARQLLVENVLLGLTGGLLGVLAAFWLHRMLPSLLPADFPRVQAIALDLRVLAFALAVSVVSAVAFGLLPALQARRINLVESLSADALAPVGGSTRGSVARSRALIMAGQVAVACVLLVGASLLGRSFMALLNVDPGYDVENVLTARLPMNDPAITSQRRRAILAQVLDRLRESPGVTQAALTTVLPLSSTDALMAFTMPPARSGGDGTQVQAGVRIVSASYFAALGINVMQGRGFGPGDTQTSQPVLVVNRAFARRYLDDNAIGRRLPEMEEGKPSWEIVGVAEDMLMRGPADPPQPEIFLPFEQLTARADAGDPNLVVRTTGDATALVPVLRTIVRDAAPTIALEGIATMEQKLMGNLARPRLYAMLLAWFAACALAIAGVGLFGVLSYSVAQRSREIAVRSALGATSGNIVRLVVGQGMVVTVAGLVVGLGAAALLTRLMSSFLFGVTPRDPLTFVVVPIVLLLVSIVACLVPARRAVKVDPLGVLRGA